METGHKCDVCEEYAVECVKFQLSKPFEDSTTRLCRRCVGRLKVARLQAQLLHRMRQARIKHLEADIKAQTMDLFPEEPENSSKGAE
jgi:hypothetical protein